MPIYMGEINKEYIIEKILNTNIKKRLAELGFTEGNNIIIENNNNNLIVKLRETKIAIEYNIAKCIMIK